MVNPIVLASLGDRPEGTRVAWRSTREYSRHSSLVISEGGRLTSEKPCPLSRACFFAPSSFPLKRAWGNSLTQKSQRRRWLFACAERPRFELGDQKIGHSLAGCCITTLPPLQDMSAFLSRACDLREGKNSEILSPTTRQVEGVCILATRGGVWPSFDLRNSTTQ